MTKPMYIKIKRLTQNAIQKIREDLKSTWQDPELNLGDLFDDNIGELEKTDDPLRWAMMEADITEKDGDSSQGDDPKTTDATETKTETKAETSSHKMNYRT